ncbi:MAG: enoyl-CoA hydratase/isomerase family protein [Chloroflexota bacterium]|nr:enoyl-CoA hydratase/isomerase family protein [Chloroflexota bacterium]
MPDVIYEKRGHYAIFTMNRPERLNAMSHSLTDAMDEAVADFNADPDMRIGILTGAGRAFTAGADLKDTAERARGDDDSIDPRWFDLGSMVFMRSPKPFIAAVNGLAIGGGMEYALDCDIRICSTDAYFGLFEVKRGSIAGYAMYHLPRMIGAAAANYVLLSGDRISPEQALRFGIVTEIVEPHDLIPRAVEIAELIASNAPLSIEGTKRVALSWRQALMGDSERVGELVLRRVLPSEDAREGPIAFAEKREAHWQGR